MEELYIQFHCLDCLRNYTVRIAVADGVVYTVDPKFVGYRGVWSINDSWITSAIGGLAFSEISGDKKGPESGLYIQLQRILFAKSAMIL